MASTAARGEEDDGDKHDGYGTTITAKASTTSTFTHGKKATTTETKTTVSISTHLLLHNLLE